MAISKKYIIRLQSIRVATGLNLYLLFIKMSGFIEISFL